jgi:hypothetical protein
MTKKRLPADVLQEDLDTYAAFLALEDYAPSNAQYARAIVKGVKDSMTANQTAEIQVFAAANAKRDATVDSELEFHQLILGVKHQVKAQYGENSNELQALGLKKKSDYKRGRKKALRSNTAP